MPQPTLAELTEQLLKFVHERDWKQFHNPKDMAISLTLEAAEVLELMQWKNGEELAAHLAANREAMADELSDVLFWVLEMAHHFQIDLGEAFPKKLAKNALKSPVEKSRGKSTKYTEL
jgi:NTP pyrophosphatase (non-canonical NTP hydrolase)